MGKKEMNINKTICALATQPGGALGIIRISGSQSFDILSQIFNKDLKDAKPNTIHFGRITDDNGEMIDEVLVSIFRAPHSYTGEDSVEISCHGSRYIINKILQLLIQHGCRMAEPGEYTKRAYLNGKMDLSQAEAVADLIASTNRATHSMAMSQLKGHFSNALVELRQQLLRLTSLLELELDFSDHEDLEFADRSELRHLAITVRDHVGKLADSFKTGEAIKRGIPVAIVGKTNVGKSTLLNQLLGDERAIVSNIHGTTRDTIEDTIDLHGVTFRFIDTAGLRATSDEIERIGIERTWRAIDKANIVLWLVDACPTEEETAQMLSHCEGKHLLQIRNKIDLGAFANEKKSSCCNISSTLSISAKKGMHIDELKEAIFAAAEIPELQEGDIIVSSARHYAALCAAREDLQHVLDAMDAGFSGDLVAEDLRMALEHLAEITGSAITPNEVLGNIFQHFCVGK